MLHDAVERSGSLTALKLQVDVPSEQVRDLGEAVAARENDAVVDAAQLLAEVDMAHAEATIDAVDIEVVLDVDAAAAPESPRKLGDAVDQTAQCLRSLTDSSKDVLRLAIRHEISGGPCR